MQEADADINVVGVELRGGVGSLEVEERFVRLGRAVMLGVISRSGHESYVLYCVHPTTRTMYFSYVVYYAKCSYQQGKATT